MFELSQCSFVCVNLLHSIHLLLLSYTFNFHPLFCQYFGHSLQAPHRLLHLFTSAPFIGLYANFSTIFDDINVVLSNRKILTLDGVGLLILLVPVQLLREVLMQCSV